jgi:hypothetical protein
MINPHNVGKLLSNCISKLSLSHHYNYAYGARDKDVVRNLFNNIEFVPRSTHQNFEAEYTIHFSYDINHLQLDMEDESETNIFRETFRLADLLLIQISELDYLS